MGILCETLQFIDKRNHEENSASAEQRFRAIKERIIGKISFLCERIY